MLLILFWVTFAYFVPLEVAVYSCLVPSIALFSHPQVDFLSVAPPFLAPVVVFIVCHDGKHLSNGV